MKTIRRLYFYLVAFISMEVVLWGLIGLARSLFSDSVGGGADDLAYALALIVVGVPVFGIHWWAAERNAHADAGEHASGVRAFFLYAALFALFVPIAQSVWAVLNRILLQLADISQKRALLGGSQSFGDNLISIAMNAAIGLYFLKVLRDDWVQVGQQESLRLTRRIYRYLWVLYPLGMLIGGLQQVLRYLLSLLSSSLVGSVGQESFLNGLALLVVGAPLWYWSWKKVQDSLDEPGERSSLLRLGVLYFLSLASVITVLSSAGVVVKELLDLILGNTTTFAKFMRDIRGPLSIGIPLGAVWAYYGYWLKRDLAAVPDAPRRAGMNRLYSYILAFIGLAATFSGVAMLLSFFVDLLRAPKFTAGGSLTDALATLIVAMPLWLLTWRPMQAEALAEGEAGEHARRSLIRRIYLYLAIFVGVIGGMIAAVRLVSLLLEALLGSPERYFLANTLDALEMLVLFSALLAYHWKTLQADGTRQSALLDTKLAEFNVLYLGKSDDPLALQLASVMAKECPEINLVMQPAPEMDSTIHALLLPEDAALGADKKLKAWINEFTGGKFIVPSAASGTSEWLWASEPSQIAKALQQLAEGEKIQLTKKAPGWMIVIYILAGLMAFEILFILMMSTLDALGIL